MVPKASYPSPEEASGSSNSPYPRNQSAAQQHDAGAHSANELDLDAQLRHGLGMATAAGTAPGHHHQSAATSGPGVSSGGGPAPDPTATAPGGGGPGGQHVGDPNVSGAAQSPYQQTMYAASPYGHPQLGGLAGAAAALQNAGAGAGQQMNAFQPAPPPPGMAPPPTGGMRAESGGTDPPPAKKKKASRACDECRRKKIKCDKANDDLPCSNCQRTNSTNCKFERQPGKRGPSKGYIKELSDRVASLEQLGLIRHDGSGPSSPLGELNRRKRTHSMSEGMQPFASPAGGSAAAGWAQPNQPAQVAPLAPLATIVGAEAFPTEGPANTDLLVAEEIEILHLYEKTVAITFPLLTSSRDGIQAALHVSSGQLRKAFFATIRVACSPYESGLLRNQAVVEAFNQFPGGAGQINPTNRSYAANVVYLEALAFLILAVNLCGHPNNFVAATLRQGVLLSYAKETIAHLQLSSDATPPSDTPPAVREMGRRVFWVLLILDVYYALGTGTMPIIHHEDQTFSVNDKEILAGDIYNFALSCQIVHNLVKGFTSPRRDAAQIACVGSLLRTCVRVYLVGAPNRDLSTQYMLFHFLDMLVDRLLMLGKQSPPSDEILYHVQELVGTLYRPDNLHAEFNGKPATPMICPLAHYFFVFTARTLLDLVEFQSTKQVARVLLDILARQMRDNDDQDKAWQVNWWLQDVSRAIDNKMVAMAANDNLRELADAAVSGGAGAGGPDGVDDPVEVNGVDKDEANGASDTSSEESGKDWGLAAREGYMTGLFS